VLADDVLEGDSQAHRVGLDLANVIIRSLEADVRAIESLERFALLLSDDGKLVVPIVEGAEKQSLSLAGLLDLRPKVGDLGGGVDSGVVLSLQDCMTTASKKAVRLYALSVGEAKEREMYIYSLPLDACSQARVGSQPTHLAYAPRDPGGIHHLGTISCEVKVSVR
jgi:hypothetical protein